MRLYDIELEIKLYFHFLLTIKCLLIVDTSNVEPSVLQNRMEAQDST